MEMWKLKNGSEEPKVAVMAVMASIDNLIESHPLAAYDLVMMCREPSYQPFGSNGKALRDLALVGNDGRIHESIRNVVLSSARGEGLDMTFGNPRA